MASELLFLSCIPRRLNIPEYPELSVFPLNVVFTRYRNTADGLKSYTATYVPDFETYRVGQDEAAMNYKNDLNPRFHLEITYNKVDDSYRGERFEGEASKGVAFGQEWRLFFGHLGLIGLIQGENVRIDLLIPNGDDR